MMHAYIATTCPHCGRKNDCHSPQYDEQNKPEVGDLSMCIGCGQFSRFGNDMQLHALTAEENCLLSQDAETVQNMTRSKLAWLMMKIKQEAEKRNGPA